MRLTHAEIARIRSAVVDTFGDGAKTRLVGGRGRCDRSLLRISVSASAFAALVLACLGVRDAPAAEAPYEGWDDRSIASLSAEDLRALEAGEGRGFALPAELNGWPGPRHVLDEAEALGLTPRQREAVERVFAEMRAAAQEAGREFVDAERALDEAFRDDRATPERIANLAAASGAARATLRAVHLKAHLTTAPVLTAHQRAVYAELRGYGGGGHAGGHGHDHGDGH
ncbi:MAG: Spy/CpxP family protein refolding chaperone [Pseudomonadota bacterium]